MGLSYQEIGFSFTIFVALLSILLVIDIPKEGQEHLDTLLERAVVYGMPPTEKDLEKFIEERIISTIRPLVNRNKEDNPKEAEVDMTEIYRQYDKAQKKVQSSSSSSSSSQKEYQQPQPQPQLYAKHQQQQQQQRAQAPPSDPKPFVPPEVLFPKQEVPEIDLGCFERNLIHVSSPVFVVLQPDTQQSEKKKMLSISNGKWVVPHKNNATEGSGDYWVMSELICGVRNTKCVSECSVSLFVSKEFGFVSFDSLIPVSYGTLKKKVSLIPKVIHLIWTEDRPLPESSKSWTINLVNQYPEWRVYIWNQKNIQELDLVNKKQYDQVDDLEEKVNIVKYDVLYRFGGIFAEIRQSWNGLNPSDLLKLKKGQILLTQKENGFLSTSLVIAPPRNPVILRANKLIPYTVKFFHDQESNLKTGSAVITQAGLNDFIPKHKNVNELLNSIQNEIKENSFNNDITIIKENSVICDGECEYHWASI